MIIAISDTKVRKETLTREGRRGGEGGEGGAQAGDQGKCLSIVHDWEFPPIITIT